MAEARPRQGLRCRRVPALLCTRAGLWGPPWTPPEHPRGSGQRWWQRELAPGDSLGTAGWSLLGKQGLKWFFFGIFWSVVLGAALSGSRDGSCPVRRGIGGSGTPRLGGRGWWQGAEGPGASPGLWGGSLNRGEICEPPRALFPSPSSTPAPCVFFFSAIYTLKPHQSPLFSHLHPHPGPGSLAPGLGGAELVPSTPLCGVQLCRVTDPIGNLPPFPQGDKGSPGAPGSPVSTRVSPPSPPVVSPLLEDPFLIHTVAVFFSRVPRGSPEPPVPMGPQGSRAST